MNVNNLLPKIDEIRYIVATTNVAIVGICESKHDEIILRLEIQIYDYVLLRCDRNRNGGGVACYIRSDIGYVQKRLFQREIGNIFVEILLSKTKPLIAGNIYRPPNQINFLEIINAMFGKLDTDTKESYILGDFNINIYQNNKYILRDLTRFRQSSFPAILKTITNFVQCMA